MRYQLKNLIFSILICFSSLFFAEPIKLFENGKQKSNYKDLVAKENLEGKSLLFEDGREFKVLGVLGEGKTTLVLKVKPQATSPGDPAEMALRIPLSDGYYRVEGVKYAPLNELGGLHPNHFVDYIDYTMEGYKALKATEIAIPKIYSNFKNQYIALEIVPHDYTFLNYLLKPDAHGEIEKQEAREALAVFARQLTQISYIDDFHSNQLVYDRTNKKWWLLDWTGAKSAGWIFNKKPFDPFSKFLTKHKVALKIVNKDLYPWRVGLLEEMSAVIQDASKKESIWSSCRKAIQSFLLDERGRKRGRKAP